jgi:transcription elongation factor GreB
MSHAFVNEVAGNAHPDLPERPVPPGPNIVTPRDLVSLHARIAHADP